MDIRRPFSKRKPTPAPAANAAPGSSPSTRPLARYYGAIFGSLTLVLLGVGGLLYFHAKSMQEIGAMLEAGVQAQSVASRLSSWVLQQRALLQAIADDPELARLFREQDVQGLDRRAKVLAPLFPGALALELLPLEAVEAAVPESEEIGYAALDLLRTAGSGASAPPLEVHRFASPEAHIALAAGVRAGGEGPVAGLIYVRLPASRLGQQLQRAAGLSAAMALEQTPPGGSSLRLASVGTMPQTDPDGVIPISDSIWRLAYWYAPTANSASRFTDGFWLPAILVVGWLLLALVTFFHYRRMRRDLAADVNALVDVARSKLKYLPLPETSPRLRELAQAIQRVGELNGYQVPQNRMVASGGAPGASLDAAEGPVTGEPESAPAPEVILPPEIFRSYDIRGLVGKTLNSDILRQLGQAFASEALERGENTLVLGRDGRLSSPEFHAAFRDGAQAAGADIIDLGEVPTPLVYFATSFLGSNSGAVVTGSHNPPDYNGVKLVLQGKMLAGSGLQALRSRVKSGNLRQGSGNCLEQGLVPDYIEKVVEDVQLARPLRLVVDGGNGVAGPVAVRLLRELGCEVIELFCEVDGRFPNHHPDPGRPDNLLPLVMEVAAQEADLGLAFDGDGDRIGVVDSSGKIIWPDRLLMLLAEQVLAVNPGADIVFDVKSSQRLGEHVRSLSGCPVLCATGHSVLKAKAREIGAPLAGELSGHILFQDRWNGYDDALYAAARVLEILALDPRPSAEVFAELPDSPATPELLLSLDEGQPQAVMQRLFGEARFDGATINRLDGLRVEFPDGWGLVRASNTTPALSFRFEAANESRLEEIKALFRAEILALDPALNLPF